MKRWSYQLALTVLSACIFVFTPSLTKAGPYDSYDPGCCWDPCSFGGFEVGGEFLWWKPCLDHLEFAISNSPRQSSATEENDSENGGRHVRYKNLCPEWEPGVKLWAYKPAVFCGCCGLGVSWIGIWSDHCRNARDFDDGLTIPSSIEPLFAWDKVGCHFKGQYHDYDVLLSFPCCCGDCSVIRPFFGFAGLVLDQEMHWKGRNEGSPEAEENAVGNWESKKRWCSDLHAYGLRVGSEYECKLADCLKVYGRFAISLVTGRPDTKHHEKFWNGAKGMSKNDNVDERPQDEKPQEEQHSKQDVLMEMAGGHRFRDDECYRIYPGYRLAAGAVYETCFCNTDISFRLGYEFIQWHNLPHHRRFVDHLNPNGTSTSDRTLGWQGLTAGVGICF